MTADRVSLQEAALMLGVSDKTVRRYIAAGDLPAERVGPQGRARLLRMKRADVEALVTPVPTVGESA